MKQIEKEGIELVPLNSKFEEFNLQIIENRLETDPLPIAGLLNLIGDDFELQYDCNIYNCGEMICGGYNC